VQLSCRLTPLTNGYSAPRQRRVAAKIWTRAACTQVENFGSAPGLKAYTVDTWVKRPKREAGCSRPSIALFKNEWNFASTP
jgi:hypothetical protein